MRCFHLEHHQKTRIEVKSKNFIILAVLLTATILNKYILKQNEEQWRVHFLSVALVLGIYAYDTYKTNRSLTSLFLLIIFASELAGVVLDFNMSQYYYTEFILALMVGGLISIFKKWVKR